MTETALRCIAYIARAISRTSWRAADRMAALGSLVDMILVSALFFTILKGSKSK